jgi:hypothetical protein
MKPGYAEMIIAIHLDGMKPGEYAESIGKAEHAGSPSAACRKEIQRTFSENVLFVPLPWLQGRGTTLNQN